jgi:SulP family sulfate permease
LKWLVATLGGALVGLTTVVYTISFFAIVFSGPLADHVGQWVGGALIAAAVMALVGALTFSFKGTVMHPQDVTAALLSVAAAKISAGMPDATDTEVVATVLTMVAVTGFLAGLAAIGIGRARLSHLVHVVPQPVILGFLAATGAALLLGAIAIATERSLTIWDLPVAFESQSLAVWAPWLLVSGAVYLLGHVLRSPLLLPVSISATLAGYHVLRAAGAVADAPYMVDSNLVAPDGGFGPSFALGLYLKADWSMIAREVPLLAAIAGLTVVGGLLNLSGLRQITGHKSDADKDLQAIGIANLASAPLGGLVGFPAISTTFLGLRVHLGAGVAPLAAAIACVMVSVLGVDILAAIPKGLFATIVGYLGLDMLIASGRIARNSLTRTDQFLFIGVVATALTLGFLHAIALGLVAAVLLFARDLARVDILHKEHAAALSSPVPRIGELKAVPNIDMAPQLTVVAFQGYLFFGVCNRLLNLDRDYLHTDRGLPDIIQLDLSRVSGLDISAALSLADFLKACAVCNVTTVVSGASKDVLRTLGKSTSGHDISVNSFTTLEAALAQVEQKRNRLEAGQFALEVGARIERNPERASGFG